MGGVSSRDRYIRIESSVPNYRCDTSIYIPVTGTAIHVYLVCYIAYDRLGKYHQACLNTLGVRYMTTALWVLVAIAITLSSIALITYPLYRSVSNGLRPPTLLEWLSIIVGLVLIVPYIALWSVLIMQALGYSGCGD